jgi:hypothetical protein
MIEMTETRATTERLAGHGAAKIPSLFLEPHSFESLINAMERTSKGHVHHRWTKAEGNSKWIIAWSVIPTTCKISAQLRAER